MMPVREESFRWRTTWAVLAMTAAAAVFLRLMAIDVYGGHQGYQAWSMRHFFGGITPTYLALAEDLLGLRYGSLAYPPGYPAFIAVARLAGITELGDLRILQAAIDVAGIFLVYFLLGRAGVRPGLRLCGAAVYATYPLWAVGSTFLLAEFVTPVFVLAALALTVVLGGRERPTPLLAAGGGVLLGFFALTRPDLVLLPGLLAAWLLWRRPDRRGIAAIALLLASFSLPLAAWGLHNRIQHGHWVFTTTGGGNALWEGLGEVPNDYGFVLDDQKAGEVLAKRGLKWLSVEADRYFKSEYLRAWREHPEFVVGVIRSRWMRVIVESEGWFSEARPYFLLKRAFELGGWALFAFALLAFRRSPERVLLVGAPLIYALLSIGLTHWEARYGRYVQLSYLFALVLLVDAFAERVGRFSRRAAAAVLVTAAGATTWAAASVLAQAAGESQGTRLTVEINDRAARGELEAGYGLCGLAFSPFVPDARLARRGCALEVSTSSQPYAYQAMAEVVVPEGSAVHMRFGGVLEAGGIHVGLLSGDETRFIAGAGFSKAGEFAGEVSGYGGRSGKVKVVVSNWNPAAASSRAILARLELQCHPHPCGPGKPGR